MGDYYDAQLGPLKAQPVLKAPAVIFYVFYLGFLLKFGVLRALDARESLQRGSLMGLFAYGTYEFTNWAVIQGWPRRIGAGRYCVGRRAYWRGLWCCQNL